MPTPQRTTDGKWVIFDRATGQRLERWPVDARELLASGDFTADAPNGEPGDSPAAPASSAPELSAPPATEDPAQLVPGLAVANREHSPGVPLVAMTSADASPAAPLALPTGRIASAPAQLPGATPRRGRR